MSEIFTEKALDDFIYGAADRFYYWPYANGVEHPIRRVYTAKNSRAILLHEIYEGANTESEEPELNAGDTQALDEFLMSLTVTTGG